MRFLFVFSVTLFLFFGVSRWSDSPVHAECSPPCEAGIEANRLRIAMTNQQTDGQQTDEQQTDGQQQEQSTNNSNRQADGVNTLAAKRVKVNFYLNSISNIDDQRGTYEVDLWLDLFWYDEALVGKTIDQVDTSKLWTPKVEFVNARETSTLFETYDNSLEADTNLRLSKRLVATFFTSFNLRRFPFDQQHLVLKLESVEFESNQVLFDLVSLEQPPAHSEQGFVQPIPLGKYFSNDTDLQGWTLSNSQIVQQIRVLPYDKSSWSQFRIEITATRQYMPYIWKIVLVLLFLLFFVWGIFWLDVSELRYRLLLLGTLLLSLTTLDYKMVQILPQTAYLTVLDVYMAVCYAMLIAAAILVMLIKLLAETKFSAWSARLNRAMLLVYPFVIVLINLALFWYGMS